MLVILFLCLTTLTLGEWITEMENPGLFEGDIVLDPDEKLGYASIKGGRWPNAVIPYEIESSVSSGVRANIPKAIAEYEKYTCIRFKKRTTESAYISFYGGGGCSSPVGYRAGRRNRVSLASGCRVVGIIMHEIGHSIGIYHEQSRPDRDDYVEIIFSNIQQGMAYNFNKQPASRINSLGTKYDYLSMMHYGKTAFGRGKMTIRTKDPAFQNRIGGRGGFSEIDKVQINRMYCGGTVPTQPPVKTTTTTKGPSACEDKPGKPCASWVKSGYCKNFESVRRDCCKSCKEGVVTTAKPATTKPPTCVDVSGKPCASWVKAGYCPKYESVRRNCCKSCKEGTTCVDVAGKPCASWVKAGYCPKYESVRRDCCKSCKEGVVATTKPVVTTAAPSCIDVAGKPCEQWYIAGYCPKYSSVKRDCCKTCRDGIPCADKNSNCSKYGADKCTNTSWKNYMKSNCRKFCKLC